MSSQTADQDGFEADCMAWINVAKNARPYRKNQRAWRAGFVQYVEQELRRQGRQIPRCIIKPYNSVPTLERVTIRCEGVSSFTTDLDMSDTNPRLVRA